MAGFLLLFYFFFEKDTAGFQPVGAAAKRSTGVVCFELVWQPAGRVDVTGQQLPGGTRLPGRTLSAACHGCTLGSGVPLGRPALTRHLSAV